MLLPQSFYARDTVTVAQELLGCLLVHQVGDSVVSGRIVETEAYLHDDPAAHSFRGETERNRIMFGASGYAYVYFIYGMHWCVNAVTGTPDHRGEAVLIRALEPVEGIPVMIERRGLPKLRDLCSGPSKLCQALDITRTSNGVPLFDSALTVHSDETFTPGEIITTTRIGIVKGAELPLRFYLKDNRYISRK